MKTEITILFILISIVEIKCLKDNFCVPESDSSTYQDLLQEIQFFILKVFVKNEKSDIIRLNE